MASGIRPGVTAGDATLMTNQIAMFLGLLILVGLGVDWHYFEWEATVFLSRKFAQLIEWVAFWR